MSERFLLDTHTLIWWWLEDPKLSRTARDSIADARHENYVSAVSAYEIGLKVNAGRLPGMAALLSQFAEASAQDGFLQLPMRYDHAREAGLLPLAHRDPFDRMIAAQALIERLTVITCDRQFAALGCRTLW